MENQTALKWHQKPSSVILLLVFFFPLGLYYMWKNGVWSSKLRWGVTALFLVLVAGSVKDKEEVVVEKEEYIYENGIGTINHYTAKDWDKNAMYKNMGEKVWKFSRAHPDAKKLILIIQDECKDLKGNISKYDTNIEFESDDIKEYSSYADANSFNQNCYEFYTRMLNWKPCVKSPTD